MHAQLNMINIRDSLIKYPIWHQYFALPNFVGNEICNLKLGEKYMNMEKITLFPSLNRSEY